MCVNPIRVRNKKCSSDFVSYLDRFYNFVPCGKCHECLELHKSDYVVRSICEYQDNKKLGGFTLFYTLTYNNDHLPKFHNVVLFDKKDIQDFIKRLRANLSYRSIKYLVTSEYGTQTFRPHYHALFFVKDIDPKEFYKAVLKSWQNGFIYPGRNYGVCTCEDAVKYVTKYVSKDFNTLSIYEKDTKDLIDFDFNLKKWNKENNTKFEYKNFHLQSEQFGIALNDIISVHDLIANKITFITSSEGRKVNNLQDSYPIPLYNRRKLCYDIYKNSKGNVVYKLNDFGIKIKKKQILSRIKEDVQELENFRFNIDNYKDLLCFSSLDFDVIKFYINNVSLKDISIYKNFYRGLPQSGFFRFEFDIHSLLFNLNNYFKYYKDSFLVKTGTKKIKTIVNRVRDDSTKYDYFNVSVFDKIISVFNYTKLIHSYSRYLDRTRQYNISQYFRSLLTNKDYSINEKDFKDYIRSSRFITQSNINQDLQKEKVNEIFALHDRDLLNKVINDLKLEKCSKNVLINSPDLLECFPLQNCPF